MGKKLTKKQIDYALNNPAELNVIFFTVNPDKELAGTDLKFVDDNGYSVGVNLDKEAAKWLQKRLKKINKYLEDEQ